MKRILLIILAFCLLYVVAPAETHSAVHVEYISKQTETSSLTYPSLQGLANTFVQDTINSKIVEKGNIALHEITMTSPAQQGATGINVTSEAYLLTAEGAPAVLSLAIRAEGKMPNGRLGYTVTPMMFSLLDGSELSSESLWVNKEDAQQYLDNWVEEQSQKDIFTYSDILDAVPVPTDQVMLTETGIVLFYPPDTFTFLSGRSGAFSFYFYELKDILQSEEGTLLSTLDTFQQAKAQENSGEIIREECTRGNLPGIPDVMGKSIKELITQYKELTDSEAFVTGDRYILEDAAFRDVSLVVPFESEQVAGILTHRINLYGLTTGTSDSAACVAVLGQPDTSLSLDEDTAARYAMPTGTASFYTMGEYRLMLGFDQRDILQSVYLSTE